MSIFQDIASEIGLPTGAVALAVGVVQGAKFLERDASDRALKLFSNFITEGNLADVGKAGASLVPFAFNRIFGARPLSARFIVTSICASTLFWLLLTLAKHPNWHNTLWQLYDLHRYYAIVIPCFYIADWASLAKAKYLMRIISQRNAIGSSLLFLCVDIMCSYALSFTADMVASVINNPKILGAMWSLIIATESSYVNFAVVTAYFSARSEFFGILYVLTPSTLLTSAWALILFLSGIVAQLLVPIDYLRRFTAFWFKDVEHKPLTAIAKVAATLIVVGAFAIKAVHWMY